jgi:branched-chain amino acid transport system ATP-binding protein
MAEPGMSEAALSIAGISKNFGGLRVARNISLSLPTGARHALIGPNGAGKTTLVNIMSGLLQPSAGTIHLVGTDITHVSPERRVALGLARTFQISSLFPTLTVAENVGLAFEARFGLDRRLWGSVRKSAPVVDGAAALLHSLGLLDLAGKRVADLPYGQRRLVEIALVLALEPKILLLDEPAAGLAAADRGALLDLLLKLPEGLTILVIEHDMSLVFRLAQRITVLVEGAVLTEGTVAEIRADPRVRDVYLGSRAHG